MSEDKRRNLTESVLEVAEIALEAGEPDIALLLMGCIKSMDSKSELLAGLMLTVKTPYGASPYPDLTERCIKLLEQVYPEHQHLTQTHKQVTPFAVVLHKIYDELKRTNTEMTVDEFKAAARRVIQRHNHKLNTVQLTLEINKELFG